MASLHLQWIPVKLNTVSIVSMATDVYLQKKRSMADSFRYVLL